MSYRKGITAEMSDVQLNLLVQAGMGDRWWTLNDLQQSQLLYEVYEHRQQLCDQGAINGLLDVRPRLSLISNRHSPLFTLPFLGEISAPPINQEPAAESSTPPKSQFCQANMTNKANISPFCHANVMAEYTRRLFQHLVTVDRAEPYHMPLFPFQLPYSAIEDAHHIAALAAKAYHNPSRS